jgi:7-keto-8-aminopelargonate synthetase-like enzyme
MDKTALDEDLPPADGTDRIEDASFIDNFAGYRQLKRRMADMAKHNVTIPFFEPRGSLNDSRISWRGREVINYSGYNYLGLSGDPRVSQAAKDAIVFVSGYLTNVTVISHLLTKPDAVIFDSGAHNSILTGAQLSGAKQMSFPVGEWDKLDALMEQKRRDFRRGLVVVEGVYSMDGHILDARRAVEAKRKHDLLLMIDEAHSLGTIGATGRGVCEAAGVSPKSVDVHMGTLSKTLAGAGGYIAGSRGLIEYMRFLAPGFIFSVGLSPPDTAASLAALDILEREPQLSQDVRDRARLFRSIAREVGLTVGGDEDSPVASLLIGDDKAGFALSNRLLEQGIHVQPIPPPAVPVGGTRLRFFLTRTHTEEQFRTTLPAIAREMEQMGLMG